MLFKSWPFNIRCRKVLLSIIQNFNKIKDKANPYGKLIPNIRYNNFDKSGGSRKFTDDSESFEINFISNGIKKNLVDLTKI